MTRSQQAAKDRDPEALSAENLEAVTRSQRAAKYKDLEGFIAKNAAAKNKSRKKQSKKCNATEWDRIRNFRGNTRNGLAFACLNCRRIRFYSQVQRFNSKNYKSGVIDTIIGDPEESLMSSAYGDQSDSYWICTTCHK